MKPAAQPGGLGVRAVRSLLGARRPLGLRGAVRSMCGAVFHVIDESGMPESGSKQPPGGGGGRVSKYTAPTHTHSTHTR